MTLQYVWMREALWPMVHGFTESDMTLQAPTLAHKTHTKCDYSLFFKKDLKTSASDEYFSL